MCNIDIAWAIVLPIECGQGINSPHPNPSNSKSVQVFLVDIQSRDEDLLYGGIYEEVWVKYAREIRKTKASLAIRKE